MMRVFLQDGGPYVVCDTPEEAIQLLNISTRRIQKATREQILAYLTEREHETKLRLTEVQAEIAKADNEVRRLQSELQKAEQELADAQRADSQTDADRAHCRVLVQDGQATCQEGEQLLADKRGGGASA